MANTVQDEIYQRFLDVSQQQAAAMGQATQSLADVILQADQMRSDIAQQTAAAANPTNASRSSGSSSSSASQSGDRGGVLGTVWDVFKSGLGVSPLVQGLMSLFGGGGDSSAPAPLVKYALPPAINFQAADVNGGIVSMDYDQSGMSRAYTSSHAVEPATQAGAAAPSVAAGPGGSAPATQITVNVQALDARSLMDRSNDIALAVREAMLNMNAINDVVNDL